MHNAPVTLFKHGGTAYMVSFLEEGVVSLSAASPMEGVPPQEGYVSHAVRFNAQGVPTRMESIAVRTLDDLREETESYGFDVEAGHTFVNGTQRIQTVAYPADAAESDTRPKGTIEKDTGEQPYTLDDSEVTQVERLLRQFAEARDSFLVHS